MSTDPEAEAELIPVGTFSEEALKILMKDNIAYHGPASWITAFHKGLTDIFAKMNFFNYTWADIESPMPKHYIRKYSLTNVSTHLH